MKHEKLIREQLDRKIIRYKNLEKVVIPSAGWIYSIRQGVNMSMRQLGKLLSITPQSVKEIEEREKNDTISLKVLKQVASALNMHFIYAFIPMDTSLEKMVERRAAQIARQIVERTSVQMSLEDQKNTKERLEKTIKEKTKEFTNDPPKFLWD